MGNPAILSVRIISDAKNAVQGVDDFGNKVGGVMGKLGPVAAAGVGAAVAGIGMATKALYDLGSTFDDVEDTIRVGTGATGEALDGLVDVAHNVATTIPTSFEAAGQTVADLNTRLGLSGDTLQTVASQYLEAGRILGEDVDINATTAAFSAFGIEGEAVSGAMDSLFQVSQATGVSMNDLASSAQKNAGAMSELGFSFDDTISLVGSLDKAGIDADATLNAMRKGMISMAQPGEDMRAAFDRVTSEISGFIAAGDDAAALDLAGSVFGTKGAAQMVQALKDGTLAVDDLKAATGATSDTILGVGQDTQDAAEKWQILKNKGMEALEPLASAVFGLAGDALGSLVEWIDSTDFTPLTDALSAVGEGVANVSTWLGSLSFGPLVDLFNSLSDSSSGAGGAISDMWQKVQDLAATISANLTPVIQFLTPIIQELGTMLSTYVGEAINIVTGVLGGFVEWINGFITMMKGIFTGDWGAIWEGAKTMLSGAWNAITSIISGAWNIIKSLVSNGISGMVSILSGLGGILMGLISSAWNSASSASSRGISAVLSYVSSLPSRAASALSGIGSALLNAGKQLISGFISGITSKISAVKDTLTGLTDKLTSWKGPENKDRTLLTPAGELIISGLVTGLENKIPDVRATLEGLTRDISKTDLGKLQAPAFNTDPAFAGRAGATVVTYHITINGATDSEQTARALRRILDSHDRRHHGVSV